MSWVWGRARTSGRTHSKVRARRGSGAGGAGALGPPDEAPPKEARCVPGERFSSLADAFRIICGVLLKETAAGALGGRACWGGKKARKEEELKTAAGQRLCSHPLQGAGRGAVKGKLTVNPASTLPSPGTWLSHLGAGAHEGVPAGGRAAWGPSLGAAPCGRSWGSEETP